MSGETESEKAKAYNRAKRVLFLIELGVGFLYLVVLLFSGVSVVITQKLETATYNVWFVILLYLLIIGVAYDLVAFPIDLYGGFVLEHKFGQSTQSLRAWAWDRLKSAGIGFAIGASLAEGLYWFLRRYPTNWWLIAAAMFIAVAVIMANLAPVVLMPLFYKFTPLRNEELKKRLLALFEKANTKVRGVYEMDMSRKTHAANAALVGLGNTRRIVLADTVLERYEPDEIEAILAHELGHHENWDIWKGILFQSVLSTVSFYLAHVILGTYSFSFGMRGPSDIAAFPLLMVTIAAVSLFFLPAVNGFTRRLERRADAFALTLTRNPEAFVSMISKLGRQNLAEFEPNPILEFLLFSHPSIGKRMQRARELFPEDFRGTEKVEKEG
ncbi:M48 family metallopeptidase [Candidatus Poribacteria bacterium]|nr:M48 family metallopeptidase [Candidatus Poribacteria bacterium]